MSERTGLIYDPHHPYSDQNAYSIALDYLSGIKPKLTRLVLGGDFVDFYKISFFKTDPERMSFKKEVILVREKLKELRQRFPRIPIDYIEGNHEVRLYRHVIDNVPELAWNNKIENILNLGARNINYISNIALMSEGKEPYKIGKVFILHGHEKKVSMNAVNLARLFYSKCYSNVIAGHHHHSDWTLVRKLDGTHEGAWTVGTLGKLSESYQPINSWNHGFAWIESFDNGDFDMHNKLIINGRVLSA